MKHIIILFLVLPFYGFCQTGTLASPFTTLGQALNVPSSGIYYFNLGSTTFNTHVDANGYVQVAIDFGNSTGNLPQGTSLTNSTRGILNTTVLATLSALTEVRISSSTGNIDVLTTNSTILSKVVNNQTLHRGIKDNGVNNFWTGTNATRLTVNAGCKTNSGNSLQQNIVHVCGAQVSFHWLPGIHQREQWNSGEVASTVAFHLWVRGNSSPLPVELLNFKTELINNKFVKLSWQTASEINNDYFTIEHSTNGIDWEQVARIDGAGNSSSLLSYSKTHGQPYFGVSYYRLKQTDFNGQFEYSKIRSMNIERLRNTPIEIFPNPADKQITIYGNSTELQEVAIYNILGQNVTALTKQILNNETKIVIDISQLITGMYYIKTKTTANKVYKQ